MVSHERVPERVVEQIVNTTLPNIIEETVEVIQLEHVVEEFVVLVPQVMEERTETEKTIPQERVQTHTVEQITNVLCFRFKRKSSG